MGLHKTGPVYVVFKDTHILYLNFYTFYIQIQIHFSMNLHTRIGCRLLRGDLECSWHRNRVFRRMEQKLNLLPWDKASHVCCIRLQSRQWQIPSNWCGWGIHTVQSRKMVFQIFKSQSALMMSLIILQNGLFLLFLGICVFEVFYQSLQALMGERWNSCQKPGVLDCWKVLVTLYQDWSDKLLVFFSFFLRNMISKFLGINQRAWRTKQ